MINSEASAQYLEWSSIGVGVAEVGSVSSVWLPRYVSKGQRPEKFIQMEETGSAWSQAITKHLKVLPFLPVPCRLVTR